MHIKKTLQIFFKSCQILYVHTVRTLLYVCLNLASRLKIREQIPPPPTHTHTKHVGIPKFYSTQQN